MVSRKWLIVALVVTGFVGGCSQFNTNLTTQTSSSTLTFLSPQTANAGDADLPIVATGTGFVTGAIILWNVGPNQVQLTTTFVSSVQLTATVPASDITAAGNVQVAVQIVGSAVSGASGTTATTTTEVSNVVNFVIQPKAGSPPTLSSISASTTSMPATPYCGATGFTLTATGANFDSSSVVNWNGSPRATTFVNSGQLTASILPQDAAFPGTASVTVSNAAGPSNAAIFTMTTPATNLAAPSITAPLQLTIPKGSPTFAINIDGNILPCTVAQWIAPGTGGNVTTQLVTGYVSANQDPTDAAVHLNVTIPAGDVVTASSAQIVLFTMAPPTGGQTSNAVAVTIQ